MGWDQGVVWICCQEEGVVRVLMGNIGLTWSRGLIRDSADGSTIHVNADILLDYIFAIRERSLTITGSVFRYSTRKRPIVHVRTTDADKSRSKGAVPKQIQNPQSRAFLNQLGPYTRRRVLVHPLHARLWSRPFEHGPHQPLLGGLLVEVGARLAQSAVLRRERQDPAHSGVTVCVPRGAQLAETLRLVILREGHERLRERIGQRLGVFESHCRALSAGGRDGVGGISDEEDSS